MKYKHQTKTEQVQSETQTEKTKTKTTTRYKHFVIIAVVTGVIAAMSQLFTSPFMPDVEALRKNHKEVRNQRDSDRVESVKFLNHLVESNILPDSLSKKAVLLISSHSKNQQLSQRLFNELKSLKKSKRFSGFKNFNLFLANIGNPVFILVTGILFMILYLFRRKIDWENLAKSFLYLSLMYLSVATVYLIWVFSNSLEIHKVYYISGLIFGSLFAVIGLKYFLKYLFKVNSIEEEKQLKAIRILFRQLLHNIPKKNYVKEEKFAEFTKSNNKVINEVVETME